MKTKRAVICLLAVLGLAPITSYAADDVDTSQGDAKSFVKDSAIAAKIKSKLAVEHLGTLTGIHVDTDANGIVWLSGTASSNDEIDKIVSIARATEHVSGVKSHIMVKMSD